MLGIFLARPSPLTPPSPLWGEGVASCREKEFAYRLPLSRRRHRWLLAVEPDAGEVAEQGRELFLVGLRQRRLEQRGDVAAQMRGIAGAEQHDVDARLMARKPVGRLDQIGGAGLVHQKAERIVARAEPRLDQTL